MNTDFREKMHSFETVVDAMWASLMSRHAKKVRGVPKYAPAVATKPEFREWLRAESVQGKGSVWICAYSGENLSFRSDKQESCLSIDHYLAMERGGLTEISNLVVCSRQWNNAKRDVTPTTWALVQVLFKAIPETREGDLDRRSILSRLCAQQTFVKHQRARQKAKAAVLAGTGRGW